MTPGRSRRCSPNCSSSPGRDGCRRRGSCSTSTRRTTRCTAARRAAPSTATTATTASCRSYIFCGKHPLCAVLRPGNSGAASGATEALARIVARLRRRWPGLGILVRADSRLRPRGTAGLVRGQRRGLRHRRRPQRPARPENRAGTPRRPGRVAGPPPPGPHLRGVRPLHPEELVPLAPRHRQGRASAGQAQPPLRRHLAPGDPLPPDRLRTRVLPPGQRRERHQGAAARPVRRPDLRHPLPPPTSSGSSSPPSHPSSWPRCAARSPAPAWPAPPPARCA